MAPMRQIGATSSAFLADERANAAVEFALVVPMLLVMVLAVWEFGNAVSERSQLETAARAGAQAAFADPSDTAAIEDAVANATGLTPADLFVNVSTACECADGSAVVCSDTCAVGSVRTVVTVHVSKVFTLTVNVPALDGAITLTGRAIVRAQ